MKSRVLMIMIVAVLMTGCSTKDDNLPAMESDSSGAYEEEVIHEEEGEEQLIEDVTDDVQEELNPEEKDETAQEELISEEMAGEEQEENAEPIFSEFEELCFLQLESEDSDNYLVFYLYADGKFEGETKKIYYDDVLNGQYNRFSGRFEIEKKEGDGVYLLYMPELYLQYEPGSEIEPDDENGMWIADPLDSLVQGLYFYLCLEGANVNCLPQDYQEDGLNYIPYVDSVFERDYIINRDVSDGYSYSTVYFCTDSIGRDLFASDRSDTVTGENRKQLLSIASASDDFLMFGCVNYVQIDDGPDTYTECAFYNNDYGFPYYLDFLDVYNCSIEDIEIKEITIEILEYIPLDEMTYYVGGGPGGESDLVEERGLYAELDPIVEKDIPLTQADLYYSSDFGFPDIIPTYKNFEQTFISKGGRILYAVGVVPERVGYYRYCFHIDYFGNGKEKRISSEPMHLLATDLSDVELEERIESYWNLRDADV